MPVDPGTVYVIAKASYAGGKFAYKQADKRVGRWAEEQDISKREAWKLVRAEATRRGDASIENAADRVIAMGWKAALLPGGSTLMFAAHGWKAAKRRHSS
ncbi:MAG TPA: hypothetical protein VHO29_16610 [Marmoricola sp.]|nr:hypothetical protein [Marmoricola sp.]